MEGIRRRRLGRVISFDVRANRMGFVCVRDGNLCDWGTKRFQRNGSPSSPEEIAVPFATGLMDAFRAHAVLLPRIVGTGSRQRSANAARAIVAIGGVALKRGIAVHLLSRRTVREFAGPVEQVRARN